MRRQRHRAWMVAVSFMMAGPVAAADPTTGTGGNPVELVEPDPAPPPVTVVDGLRPLGAGGMRSVAGGVVVLRSGARAFGHVDLTPAGRPAVGPAMAAEEGAVAESHDLPTEFALRRSMPNPSRGSATIGFDLPIASHVRLEVFDLQGRQVDVLADGEFPAGRHSRSWSAGVESGERLRAGVYFARFDARAVAGATRFTKIAKLVLIE